MQGSSKAWGRWDKVVVPNKINKQNKTRPNSRLPPKENKQNKLLTNWSKKRASPKVQGRQQPINLVFLYKIELHV